jgi:uncharacterized sulfatase
MRIVLIMTDTQRADMLGCYGNVAMRTPNLDRLASQGIRFERAYACQPVCGPARSALFTGTFPHTNGSWGNSMPLGDNVKTVGQRLSDKGIRAAYVGKWHLDGGDYFGLGRVPDGWDPAYWYDMRCYLEELSPEDRRDSRSFGVMKGRGVTEDFTFGHRCSDRAISFLERHGAESDFLLVLSYDEPHGPSVCPEPYASMYDGYAFPKSPNVWDTLADKPEHHRVWAGERLAADKDALAIRAPELLGCNSFVDNEIGRVLHAVDRHAPDAMVIYTSDHGDMLWSHSLHGKGPATYDEITRVPFIARWPGVTPAGSVCRHPTSHIDVVPTIMHACGIRVPRLLEGKSMLDVLRDPGCRLNDAIFMEFTRYEIDHDGFGGYQPLRAAYDGRHKLTVNLLTSDELYDLEKDPAEMRNLIGSDVPEHRAVRCRLHDLILDWMNRTRDPFRGYAWERRPWRIDARPATWGYTGMTRQRENEEEEPRQLDYDTGLPITEAVRRK